MNSALQRARKAVDERLPEQSQQATLRPLGDERVREIVERYVDAWARGDVESLRALLAEDAAFSMPPWARLVARTRDHRELRAGGVESCAKSLAVRTRANGQLAIAYYQLEADTGRHVPVAIDVLTLEGA